MGYKSDHLGYSFLSYSLYSQGAPVVGESELHGGANAAS